MNVQPDSVLARAGGAEAISVRGELVILDPSGQMIRGVNRTGAEVWDLLDGGRSALAIASCVAERYARPLPAVLPDVMAFLNALSSRGLAASRPEVQTR
jgi:hypothetical protein